MASSGSEGGLMNYPTRPASRQKLADTSHRNDRPFRVELLHQEEVPAGHDVILSVSMRKATQTTLNRWSVPPSQQLRLARPEFLAVRIFTLGIVF